MQYSTADLATAARTSLRAIRLWEGHNLFGHIDRNGQGERVFTDAHLQRAKEISAAQMAGMTLREIKGATGADLYKQIDEGAEFMRGVKATIYSEFDL